MAWPRETIEIVGSRGWHSNIFCTPIFVLGQDESPGQPPKYLMVKSQTALCWTRVNLAFFLEYEYCTSLADIICSAHNHYYSLLLNTGN